MKSLANIVMSEELEIRLAARIQELEAAMLQIRDCNEWIALATDAAQMGTFDWDVVAHTIKWNNYHELLLGYAPGVVEHSYANWECRVHPADLERADATMKRSMNDRTDYSCEYRVIWVDGSIHWLASFGRFYYDQKLQPMRMAGVTCDITDRKQDELNLRRSEEFNRRILENNQDCIKVLDLDGRLLYLNDGGKKLLEIDDFAKYDRALWVTFWGGSEQASAQMALEAAKQGEASKFEGQCSTAKGTLKWWQVSVSPLFDDLGNVEQILSIAHDITDQIQAEAEIRESEERFRVTFEQAAVGVAHVSVDGQWLRVNQKLCEIVGYSDVELLNTTFQDITHPDDLAADLEHVRRLLAGEIQNYAMEKRYIHKSGQIVWVNITVSLRRQALGAPIHFIAAIEEIGDRKQAEFELVEKTLELARIAAIVKQRNQDLDQFAHIVSHDLKAPLRAIANLSTWIEEDLEGKIPIETQEHLTLMRSRVDRMEGLINGLLEYARVGNTPASATTFQVEDLLAEIVDSLSISPSFTIDLPTDLPPIVTNRILLGQVLANLLGNACKHHNRPDGKIRVTAQPQAEIWTFTVADDGAGIAPEHQERVFGVFQTLTTRDSQENTGIGLSIVKKIVESQGGTITLESELGRGATFRFSWVMNN